MIDRNVADTETSVYGTTTLRHTGQVTTRFMIYHSIDMYFK
jgi:hypothetical protein